jgi:hypothetical protein
VAFSSEFVGTSLRTTLEEFLWAAIKKYYYYYCYYVDFHTMGEAIQLQAWTGS